MNFLKKLSVRSVPFLLAAAVPVASLAQGTDCSKAAKDWLGCSEQEARRLTALPGTAGESCETWSLSIRQADARWFVEHLSDFRALEQALTKASQFTSERITALSSDEKPFVLQQEDFQKDRLAVNFKMLDQYVREFNERMKPFSALNVPEFMRKQTLQDQAAQTQTGLTFQQFFDALALVSQSLNSSLSIAPAEFRLVAEERYPLAIQMQIAVNVGGKRALYAVSLNDFPHTKFEPTESERWNGILATTLRVDGKPADARARLRQLRDASPKAGCSLPVYVRQQRLPFDPLDVRGTFEKPRYNLQAWKELGALRLAAQSVSINAGGEVLAVTGEPDYSGYVAKVDTGIWNGLTTGMIAPQLLDTHEALAVAANGATMMSTGKDWKSVIAPYATAISASRKAIFALDMRGKIVRGEIGQSWKPMKSFVTCRGLAALDESTVYGLAADGWNILKVTARGSFNVSQAPMEMSKIQVVAEDTWVGLGKDDKIYFWGANEAPTLITTPDKSFKDIAVNRDGVVCGVRKDATGKVFCLR